MIIASALLLVGGYMAYTAVQNSVLIQSVLAQSTEDMDEGDDTILDFMDETFGCGGGDSKCFTGEVKFGGASISGTWYTVLD